MERRKRLILVKRIRAERSFVWKNGKNQVIIVATRPYWLSFYAASGSVVWVSTMIKEAGYDQRKIGVSKKQIHRMAKYRHYTNDGDSVALSM